MKMKHLIMEGFCDGKKTSNIYPCGGDMKLGTHCFECVEFSYAHCPNEIAISDEDGVVEEFIGFGGIMEPEAMEKRDEYIARWNKICKEKMNEAYDEFIKAISVEMNE